MLKGESCVTRSEAVYANLEQYESRGKSDTESLDTMKSTAQHAMVLHPPWIRLPMSMLAFGNCSADRLKM
jgi:hypothetical protein